MKLFEGNCRIKGVYSTAGILASHMSFDKKRILSKTFITSQQFNYCPLVWML